MANIANIVPEVELDINDNVVTLDLLCSDAYAARVLFDDLAEKITAGTLVLRLAGERITEGEG